jgi:hypothetical protein
MESFLHYLKFSILPVALLFTARSFAQCPSPHNLAVTNITNNSAVVAWDSTPGTKQYEVVVQESPNTPVSGAKVYNRFVLASALVPEKEYSICVRSVCDAGNSTWACKSIKTLASTAVSTLTAGSNITMKAYPSPVVNNLSIELPPTIRSGQINLINLIGKTVASAPVTSDNVTIDMSTLPSGIYYARFSNGSNTGFIKVVKQ